ncbi:MAG TPA: hypothetical protein VHQ21_02090, partial [Rhodanobacteraceae bacterium]|nr:hypothetical protein [Rhodanobacteraceae bacterium]
MRDLSKLQGSSFPRRRESIVLCCQQPIKMDSRFRGNDGIFGDLIFIAKSGAYRWPPRRSIRP